MTKRNSRRASDSFGTWRGRAAAALQKLASNSAAPEFVDANAELIAQLVGGAETGPRMVVNMPADALLCFLRDGRYLNAYERPVVMGARRGPSESRLHVDELLFAKEGKEYFFGAVAIGGAGVRFYGEYCLVLHRGASGPSTRIFDRNSYDLLLAPLAENQRKAATSLAGTWSRHLGDMVTVKLSPLIGSTERLVTSGRVSEALLCDEDYVEVHRKGTFTPNDIEEFRQSPTEAVLEDQINVRIQDGHPPSPAEVLWCSRRRLVATELSRLGKTTRLVDSHARGGRWR